MPHSGHIIGRRGSSAAGQASLEYLLVTGGVLLAVSGAAAAWGPALRRLLCVLASLVCNAFYQ